MLMYIINSNSNDNNMNTNINNINITHYQQLDRKMFHNSLKLKRIWEKGFVGNIKLFVNFIP